MELVESLGLNQFYENNNEAQIKDRIINELYNMKYPQLKKDFDIHSNFEFCSELKQFYVIITRPRTFLLFSENRIDEEFPFFSRMINNGIIEYINNDSYIDTIMDFYTTNQMIIRNKRQMIFLGNQAFESGHYYNAAYFYSKAGEDLLEKHAKIYYNHNILKDEIKNNKNDLSDDEIKNMSYEILNYIQDLKKSNEQIFFDNENIEAFCQINIGNYDKAIKIYENKKMFNEVGETYFNKVNDYEKAFIYYSKANNISKAIESLETSTEKGHLIRLFDYINKKEIATNLGLSEYFNCYKRNINQLFNLESGQKRIILNEIINDNIIENKIKINKDSTNNKSNDKNTQINSNQEENIIQNIKEEEAQINKNDNDLKNEKSNKYDNKRKRKKNGKRRRYYQKNKNNIKNNLINLIDEEENINDEVENETDNENEDNSEKSEKEEKNDIDVINEDDIIKSVINEENNNKDLIEEEVEDEKIQILKYIKNDIIQKIQDNIEEYIFISIFTNNIKVDEKENTSIEESKIKKEELEEIKLNFKYYLEEIKEKNEENNNKDEIFSKFNEIININNNNIFYYEPNTKKNLVKKIIINYYTNIELLERKFYKKKNRHEEYFDEQYFFEENQYYNQSINKIYLSEELIEEFSKEFKLVEKSKNFIKCYYLNDNKLMLKEIIKIIPEIYNYKSKSFNDNFNQNIKKLRKNLTKNKEEIYKNIAKSMQNFVFDAELSKKSIKNIFYPLFYLNGFFDLSRIFGNKLSISDEILINLSLNNIKANFEKVYIYELMNPNKNILFYYLNHKLKY